jgi:hypothetical protein
MLTFDRDSTQSISLAHRTADMYKREQGRTLCKRTPCPSHRPALSTDRPGSLSAPLLVIQKKLLNYVEQD